MAHREFFGDSYGIVAQSILRCLSNDGTWAGLPMFTEKEVHQSFVDKYKGFLGLSHIITVEQAPAGKGRDAYFSQAKSCSGNHHLFIDPDTGVKLTMPSRDARKFLTAKELVDITKSHPNVLVLVYDQSIDRARPAKAQVRIKLRYLKRRGLHGFAYHSHTKFILVSRNSRTLRAAKRRLQKCLKLPNFRLVAHRRRRHYDRGFPSPKLTPPTPRSKIRPIQTAPEVGSHVRSDS